MEPSRQPSSVTCTHPDGRQEVFPCSPPALPPALDSNPPALEKENDDPFWDRRLCVVCGLWMHPRDNHRVCFQCGRCSPLDVCDTCTHWDLKRWKEVGQTVEERKESSTPRPSRAPAPKRPKPTCTITSATDASAIASQSPPPPALLPATACGGQDNHSAPHTHTPTQGDEGQLGMLESESVGSWPDDDVAWEAHESAGEADNESESVNMDATFSGERALTRAMIESAWSVIREILPPHNFHVVQGPSTKSRVCASFFEAKDTLPTQPMAYCSAKVPQYREAYNEELQQVRFAISGYPKVTAVYPSAVPFITNTPAPIQAEQCTLPPMAGGQFTQSKLVLCPTGEWNKLASFWSEQVSVASFQELCSLALHEVLAKASSDTQALSKAKILSDALSASSSLSLMAALRGCTHTTMLSRDSLLHRSRLPADLKSELRQAELGSNLAFGTKLSSVVSKANAMRQSLSHTRSSFRAPQRAAPAAFATQQRPAFGRPPRGRGRQQGRSRTSPRQGTRKQPY